MTALSPKRKLNRCLHPPPPPKWVARQERLTSCCVLGGGAKRCLAFQTNAKQHLRKLVQRFKLAVFFKWNCPECTLWLCLRLSSPESAFRQLFYAYWHKLWLATKTITLSCQIKETHSPRPIIIIVTCLHQVFSSNKYSYRDLMGINFDTLFMHLV